MYGLKNGEYYNHMMSLDQSRVRKALIVVYSNDYLTLIQYLKKNDKNVYVTAKHKSSNLRFSLQITDFSFWLDPNSRSLERWLLFIYLFVSLRHWLSFFFVTGWQTFGISSAWVEYLRALFQFWSDYILHCHLEWGKLKQPFLLYKVLVESFSTNLTWFLFPSMLQFPVFSIIDITRWLLSD